MSERDALVARLRNAKCYHSGANDTTRWLHLPPHVPAHAADHITAQAAEITRLRAEVTRLREAMMSQRAAISAVLTEAMRCRGDQSYRDAVRYAIETLRRADAAARAALETAP